MNHFLVSWQCTIHMTYSASEQVPQLCTVTNLHIKLYIMHTTTILHGQNDVTMILPRSSQDIANSQDHGQDPPMWDLSVQFYVGGTQT